MKFLPRKQTPSVYSSAQHYKFHPSQCACPLQQTKAPSFVKMLMSRRTQLCISKVSSAHKLNIYLWGLKVSKQKWTQHNSLYCIKQVRQHQCCREQGFQNRYFSDREKTTTNTVDDTIKHLPLFSWTLECFRLSKDMHIEPDW